MDLLFATKFLGALFAIMNPFLTLPIFLSMTADRSVAEQRGLALAILLYTTVMCTVIWLAGGYIIHFFGVTIDSFRVAGGLVLLGIAFSMLNGRRITSHERAEHEKPTEEADDNASADDTSDDGIAFYPMTFPMIVGPGTIATLIIYSAQVSEAEEFFAF
ncbi:MAG: MarC family protein, partial [Alcaligenaceae bacterium]|nr:MarC family protein [Alcaligenaceae bacterium]